MTYKYSPLPAPLPHPLKLVTGSPPSLLFFSTVVWLFWLLCLALFFLKLVYLLTFGCAGPSSPPACPGRGEQALHPAVARSVSPRRLPLPGARLEAHGLQPLQRLAQSLWLTGLVVPQRVGSSWTQDQTHVPCMGRQTLIH